MFGFRYFKAEPTTYVLEYRRGSLVREGSGLAFWYYSPITELAAVPLNSVDVPFIFKELTSDYQEVSIQGQLVFRVAEPRLLAQLLNYTLSPATRSYAAEDPEKLPQRLTAGAQVLMRRQIENLSLREALQAGDTLVESVHTGLQDSKVVQSLGIEILDVSILAIRPMPETSRALEADAREEILRAADEALYMRRNFAVEQERALRENELQTEIAVENKKRAIRDAQLEAELVEQRKKLEMDKERLEGKITMEERNGVLVELAADNARQEADARAYAVRGITGALAEAESETVQALFNAGMQPAQLISTAFRELAASADKIGQLNISPDLMRELLNGK